MYSYYAIQFSIFYQSVYSNKPSFLTTNAYEEAEPFVNACPIAPESSYTYTVSLGSQAGTFWYHSKLSIQYADGFHSPLIIYDPADPHSSLYDVDNEFTLVQLDWWQNSSLPLMADYEASGIVPISDSGLVNGAGHFNRSPEVPWSIINVVQGKCYCLCVGTFIDTLLINTCGAYQLSWT
ncbi:multicopper oxidase [Macrolepiota fuliginosa MF-IS2]|uniref:Multicopper oxidase n=1 Tax=Macrolepiota fuliginosa MF-IS2 TaxID=1400762 RepID=A0A9P5WWT9_9AGAR|nr:multicopper oxidase [Macrolepiota fuliginosa MF-IS2]